MFRTVKGFHDIYGEDIEYWEKLECVLSKLYKSYGFKEFRLPILEKTAVFNRGIGETTDIVEKEMFTFTDGDGESVSLRPEGTASLIRAYIENGLGSVPGVKKYCYTGNMFRRERPQKGRFRQFTQSGVEVLESSSPLLDAEIITLLLEAAKVSGIENFVRMEINSVGCPKCRPVYREKLIEYFTAQKDALCSDCLRRLEKNPLRILDCKNESCKRAVIDAPVILDYLCDECASHFESVKAYLEKLGTPYTVNSRMVRGLDYYVRTAYEMVTDKLGAASAVGAGGRYDGLVGIMGGMDVPGIGFAIGLDRVVSLMREANHIAERKTDVFVLFFSGKSESVGFSIIKALRAAGIITEYDYDIASMKSQMKKANRSGAKLAVILGEDEIKAGKAALKDLNSGQQDECSLNDLVEKIKGIVKI